MSGMHKIENKPTARLDSALSSMAESQVSGPGEQDREMLPSELFDGLARSLGSGMPRRRAFALILKGLVGIALTEFGIRNAWATGTCLCNGTFYDPATQCCTANGAQRKNPIQNTAYCPNKVSHPGYEPKFDGCGSYASAFNPHRVPQRFFAADFYHCCKPHDICYGTCNGEKDGCDNTFGSCLAQSCGAAYPFDPILLGYCLETAGVYYAAVSLGGGPAFEAGQQIACDCCAESTCSQSCAGAVCGSFVDCNPPDDCQCYTTAEGPGVCAHNELCAQIPLCSSSAQCGSGSICAVGTCCGSQGVCLPLCGPHPPGVARSKRSDARKGRTSSGR